MLDDMSILGEMDPANMIGAAQDTPQQLEHNLDIDLGSLKDKTINHIVFIGMGGSALAGMLFEAWQRTHLKIPVTVIRDYEPPAWVDDKTLVIISSYSGNTEEALAAYATVKEKGPLMVAMAHSGQLADLAAKDKLPFFEIPSAAQPRMAAFYGLRAICQLTDGLGLSEGLVGELQTAGTSLKESTSGWRKNVATEHNYAKQLANYCMGKIIEIHGGPLMAAAAYKWKISINESAKNLAYFAEWPEFNHNEFIGWTSHPIEKPFAVIELASTFERMRIRQRYEISNRLLSGQMPQPAIVECYGRSAIEQLLWAVSLGDHVSTYLGILNGKNPAPVEIVEKLKDELRHNDVG